MKRLPGILSLIFVLGLTGCTGKDSDKPESSAKADKKEIITVEKTVVDDHYETSGVVRTKVSSNIAAKILARVEAVNVDEGDSAQKGQLLVLLDDNDIQAKLRSAEAAYNEAVKNKKITEENKNLAEITYDRYKKIYEEKAITKQELDEVTAKRNIARLECKRAIESANRAKGAYDEARSVLSYTKIYAPISGIVTSKNIDTGDTASPGQIILTIKDTDNLQVVSEIDESYLDQLNTGTPVKIVTENKETVIEEQVSEVVSSVDTRSRSFKIKINLTDSGLSDGQYVTVAVPVGKRETMLVPRTAVVRKGQLEGVYDANNNFRLIKTGKTYGEEVEVLSGLEPGDKIIITPPTINTLSRTKKIKGTGKWIN